MAKREINMLEGSIWDKVLKFAIPLAMTSILQQLFNATDVAVVGQYVGKANIESKHRPRYFIEQIIE